jgi:hypothetical protein
MERPCRHQTSFRLDIRELDHLGRLLGLVADELAKIGGRAQKHRTATLSETPFWLGIGEDCIDLFVDLSMISAGVFRGAPTPKKALAS